MATGTAVATAATSPTVLTSAITLGGPFSFTVWIRLDDLEYGSAQTILQLGIDGAGAHAVDEHIVVDRFAVRAALFTQLILALDER